VHRHLSSFINLLEDVGILISVLPCPEIGVKWFLFPKHSQNTLILTILGIHARYLGPSKKY